MKSPLFGIDWKIHQAHPVRRLLSALEKISLALEAPVNRLVRDARFNPLYHTGTISVFLLGIIILTGFYISLFYQVGFESSYQAVAGIEANPVGRVMRALHRYASAAALITALLHGWRTFFMDRFRGPRWLAWVTGVAMAVIVWLAGVTGYWMIWDERAAVFNDTLARLLSGMQAGVGFLLDYLYGPQAGSGWVFALLLLSVHIGITLVAVGFFFYHIKRLNRPKWLPPRFWMIGLGGLLLAAALFFPAGMLPAFDAGQMAAKFPGDLFFLFYLKSALESQPLWLWGGATAALALVTLLPWLLRRPALPVITVHAGRCTGCTLCAEDCPYKALQMAPREDESGHKLLAVLDPALCVSCGVCIGSCPTLALSLGDQPAEALWEGVVAALARRSETAPRVVFTCERHAQQGAADLIASPDPTVRIVPLTCVGMAHPDLAEKALAAGAAEVRFIGCPPEDCTNREGNVWLQHRLDRQRMPKLRRERAGMPVFTAWLPPDWFRHGLKGSASAPPSAYPGLAAPASLAWPNFVPALILMGVVLAGQLALTSFPFALYQAEEARLELVLQHRPGAPFLVAGETAALLTQADEGLDVRVRVDGELAFAASLATAGEGPRAWQRGFAQIPIKAGSRHVQVLVSSPGGEELVVWEQLAAVEPYMVVPVNIQDARLSGDPLAGERLFTGAVQAKNTGCQICHSLEPDVVLVGPSLAGVARRAESRVPGMGAAEYLRQAVLDPDAFVVEGFDAGQMVPNYLEILSKEEIEDILAFLLTLK